MFKRKKGIHYGEIDRVCLRLQKYVRNSQTWNCLPWMCQLMRCHLQKCSILKCPLLICHLLRCYLLICLPLKSHPLNLIYLHQRLIFHSYGDLIGLKNHLFDWTCKKRKKDCSLILINLRKSDVMSSLLVMNNDLVQQVAEMDCIK